MVPVHLDQSNGQDVTDQVMAELRARVAEHEARTAWRWAQFYAAAWAVVVCVVCVYLGR